MNRRDSVNLLPLSHTTLKTAARYLLGAVCVLVLTLFPVKAFSIDCNVAGDEPFSVTSNLESADAPACLICKGPWGRVSPFIATLDLTENPICTFYAATDTALPAYGKWTCGVHEESGFSPSCTTLAPQLTKIEFCLTETTAVNLTLTFDVDGTADLTVDKSAPPCSSSVPSFLGDNPWQVGGQPDIDTFGFTGTAGDEITVTLEADPQAGHNGGTASLGVSGQSLLKVTRGALPLEITATLPRDGKYSAIVTQSTHPGDPSFRGSYLLHIKLSTGSIDLIEPTANVEGVRSIGGQIQVRQPRPRLVP